MSESPQPAELDEILAHRHWVRRLARSLLGDPSLVDDVVQETWMVAMARRPAGGERLRGWLGRVVHNVVSQTRRADSRRRRREERVAVSEAGEAQRDLLAEADLHARVARAVLGLTEPYRTTLLMRYFEDLRPEQIAQRQGTTASTVRTRHQRALDLLRACLDQEFDGGRGAWSQALVPLAAASLAKPMSAFAALARVPWMELLIMSTTKKIACAVVLFAIAGLSWWALATEEDVGLGPSPAVAASLPEGVDGDAPTPALHAAVVEPLRPTPAGLSPDVQATGEVLTDLDPDLMRVHITGRVLDGRGNPFPGVLLTLFPEQATLERFGLPHRVYERLSLDDGSSLVDATSDADGLFVLEGVRVRGAEHKTGSSGQRQVQRILVRAEGLAWHAFTVTGPAAESDHDMGDLIVDAPEVELRARFVDEAGAPVEGVALLVGSWNGHESVVQHPAWAHWVSWMRWLVSDAEGRVTMRGLWPGWFSLRRLHHSYLVDEDESFSVWVAPGEVGDLGTLVMQTGGSVSGWVLSADGLPLEGAEVFVPGWDVRENILYNAGVDPEGVEGVPTALLVNWTERVRSKTGASFAYAPRQTDADGYFHQQGLAGSTVDLVIAAEGYEPLYVSSAAVNGLPPELRLQPSGTVDVTVVSAVDGRPLPDADVRGFRRSGVMDEHGIEVRASLPPSEPTGTAATWRLTGLGPDGADVEVSAEGYATSVLSVPGLSPGERLALPLALPQGASLAGRLIDDQDHPIFRGRLTLTALPVAEQASADADVEAAAGIEAQPLPSPVAPLELLTDAAGAFAWEGLAAGRWQLEVQAQDFRAPVAADIVLVRGEARALEPIVLGINCSIAGLFVDTLGGPAANASVRVLPRTSNGSEYWSAVTDDAGRFLVKDLPAGDYVIAAFPGAQVDVTLSLGEQLDLVLTQRKEPRLHGQVISEGLPVEGAKLGFFEILESTWRGSSIRGYLGITDADGRYDVVVHHVGLLQLEVTSPDGGGVAIPVRLDWDEDRRLDIGLGTAVIDGRLQPMPAADPQADEEWVAVAVLVSLDNAARLRTRRLAADGRFRFGHVAAGRYRLLVLEPEQELLLHADHLDAMEILASTEIELTEGQTLDVVLETDGG